MKTISAVLACAFGVCAVLGAACTVTINGVQIGSDAGGDARTQVSDSTFNVTDAASTDAGNSFSTCAECGAALCPSESAACNAVKQGEQSSPCKGYSECISVCTGTEAEKASCKAACRQAYPEAGALYTCLENKCALSCISN